MQVVLTTDEPRWLNWANQFVAADTADRARVIFPGASSNRAAALRLIEQAASQAGGSGRVIISVGHGAVVAGGGAAWVELAPGGSFRLEQAHITNLDQRESDAVLMARVTEMAGGMPEAQYCAQLLAPTGTGRRPAIPDGLDPVIAEHRCRGFPAAATRTAFRHDYARVGELLRQHGVAEVLFLTCRVGTASVFMTRIATDWAVSVLAYRERIVADEDGERNRTRAYRYGHTPTPGTPASRRTETELPSGYVTFPSSP